MTTYTKHDHGTFSWIELATKDVPTAKRFYGEIFGWKFDDMPAGPDMIYSMAKVGDKHVGAVYQMGKEMAGTPVHWSSYISVDEVDASTKKAVANGAKAMKEPFDVMDVGRMSVITDPSGAAVCLWQAKKHIGAQALSEAGALCWSELHTNNVDACGKFYATTFGWTPKAMDMGPAGIYTMFELPSKPNGVAGMMKAPMPNMPSYWLAYIGVNDVDAGTKKVTELGGKVHVPPTDIPKVGRFSIAEDPSGGVFALFKHV